VRAKITHTPAFNVSRGNDEVEIPVLQFFQHLTKNTLVVLKIGIHNRYIRCGCCHHSLNACRGETTAIDPLNDAYVWVRKTDHPGVRSRPVGRIVIDKDHLVVNTPEGSGEAREQWFDVRAFFERRNHLQQVRVWAFVFRVK